MARPNMTTLLGMGTRGKRDVQAHWIRAVVAENLRARMEEKGLTADQLGKLAKVGRRSVDRIRKAENTSLDTLGAVADVLETDPAALMIPKRQPMLRGSTKTPPAVENSISSARQISRHKDKR
jgi:transcriptional regulator with XRE-family HTH domain